MQTLKTDRTSLRRAQVVALVVTMLVPAVAFAAGDGGLVKTAIFHLINLVLLLGVAIYFVRAPLNRFLKDRKEQITADLEAAKKLHEEARAMLDKYGEQLSGLEAEKEQVLREYRELGESERDRIIEAAQNQADKITADAQRTVDNELTRAKVALEAEVMELATQMAEDMIKERMNANSQTKLIDGYLGELERQMQQ